MEKHSLYFNRESLYLLMFLTSINFYISILVLINLWFIHVVLVSYYPYYQGGDMKLTFLFFRMLTC